MAYCERDPYAATVLLARMEDSSLEQAPVWVGDIRDFRWAGEVDGICAGIPCQPWSLAGKRQGQADERHLGHELVRIVGELGPRWVFVENVPGFITWDGLGGLVGALSKIGFDAEWTTVSAAEVGAPHRRERVFVLAHSNKLEHESGSLAERGTPAQDVPADAQCTRLSLEQGRSGLERPEGLESEREGTPDPGRNGANGHVAHADQERRGGRPGELRAGWGSEPTHGCLDVAHAASEGLEGRGQGLPGQAGRWAVEPRVRGVSDELPKGLDGAQVNPQGAWHAEWPGVPRVARGVDARVDRLRCLGNACVPQCAEHAFRLLWRRTQ